MTSISKLALVGVVCGGLAALTGGVPAAETSAPAQPFWQLQGTGPVSAHEIAAAAELRSEARGLAAPTLLAAR